MTMKKSVYKSFKIPVSGLALEAGDPLWIKVHD